MESNMPILLFASWLKMLDLGQQIFFTISIVSTTLCAIMLVLKFSGQELGDESKMQQEQRGITLFLLIMLTIAGSVGLISSFIWTNTWLNILISLSIGSIGAFILSWLFKGKATAKSLQSDQVISSIGKVVRSIPPHRNGFGRVFLNIRDQSVPIDAITAGQELPKGAEIRVIDVLDDQMVLVESVATQTKEEPTRFKNEALRKEPNRNLNTQSKPATPSRKKRN